MQAIFGVGLSTRKTARSDVQPLLDDPRPWHASIATARVMQAMLTLRVYALYERFRPEIPPGVRGWGAVGPLEPDVIADLARREAV